MILLWAFKLALIVGGFPVLPRKVPCMVPKIRLHLAHLGNNCHIKLCKDI